PDDIEMLEDLIMAAINDVNKQIDKKVADLMPNVPGGLF
ncbi:MAG: YbaB/EbfC family nucleoid-associated protein, partial [Clostridia bacterium]|nr:YbaB/EbfC family nucleoid-associated protein [Clostridia bacterium]